MNDKKVIFKTTLNKKISLKLYAHKKNKTLNDIMNEAIEEYIEKHNVKEVMNNEL